MRSKTSILLLCFSILLIPCMVNAQPVTVTQSRAFYRSAQNALINYLKTADADTGVISRINYFINHEADSIQNAIANDASLNEEEKARGIYSLVFFAESIRENLKKQRPDQYDIPAATISYRLLLDALLHRRPYAQIIEPISAQRMQMLANAFFKFPEHPRLKDLAIYKRVVSAPSHILRFIENSPSFRFTDSLLLFVAANDPAAIVKYLRESSAGLRLVIRNKQDPYIRQIVQLSDHPNAIDLLPLVAPLAEQKLTKEEVLQKRLEPNAYFRLLVDYLVWYNHAMAARPTDYRNAIQKGIRDKALMFYVKPLNELHDSPDAVRFASIQNLRPQDLYYIITSCEHELYTSSYLGLYRRLMDFCKKNSTDSLFSIVKFDRFRNFMRMAGNYNTLGDFFSCLPRETSTELMQRYINNIGDDSYTALEKAMDVSDSFTGLVSEPEFSSMAEQTIHVNLNRSKEQKQFLGIRLYNILSQVHSVAVRNEAGNQLMSKLGDYEKMNRKTLQNTRGEVIQLVMFYGDEDGIASYRSFLSLFTDSTKWDTTANLHWITIRSKTTEPVIIYANKPLDHEKELDLEAQRALQGYLRSNRVEPTILIHRGHSYHLENTLKVLQPTVKLAILGSCGGYNNILSIAAISPDAHIIVSKQMGSKLINDPMLQMINRTLYEKKDIVWKEIWSELEERFRKDQFTSNLFSDYIPPGKNISLMVYKMFNLPFKTSVSGKEDALANNAY